MLKTEWKEQGFIDEPVTEGTDLKAEIRRLCKEKDCRRFTGISTQGCRDRREDDGDVWCTFHGRNL